MKVRFNFSPFTNNAAKNNIPSFQKRLVANGAVKSGNYSQNIKIYFLDDKPKDFAELFDADTQPQWQHNYYLDKLLDALCLVRGKNPLMVFDTYTIEDDNSMLGYCLIDNKRKKEAIIEFIETAPDYSCYNMSEKRQYKYIGETMMAFLAQMCKQQNKDLYVYSIANRKKTLDFYYNQCKFERVNKTDAKIQNSKLDKLIKSNASHSGKAVDLLG